VINAWAILNYWGHVPGLPPKSTPMIVLYTYGAKTILGDEEVYPLRVDCNGYPLKTKFS